MSSSSAYRVRFIFFSYIVPIPQTFGDKAPVWACKRSRLSSFASLRMTSIISKCLPIPKTS